MADDNRKTTPYWPAVEGVLRGLGTEVTLVRGASYVPNPDPAIEDLDLLLDQLTMAIGFALGALERLVGDHRDSSEALADFIRARAKAQEITRRLPIAPRPEGGIDLSRLPAPVRARFEHVTSRVVGAFLQADRGTTTIRQADPGGSGQREERMPYVESGTVLPFEPPGPPSAITSAVFPPTMVAGMVLAGYMEQASRYRLLKRNSSVLCEVDFAWTAGADWRALSKRANRLRIEVYEFGRQLIENDAHWYAQLRTR